MCEIIALFAQCQLAHLDSLTPDATNEQAPVELGVQGFEDQAVAVQWAQDNNAKLEVDAAHVILFGHNAGGWAVCHFTCNTKHVGLSSGIVT